jgi:hypothetical protein
MVERLFLFKANEKGRNSQCRCERGIKLQDSLAIHPTAIDR